MLGRGREGFVPTTDGTARALRGGPRIPCRLRPSPLGAGRRWKQQYRLDATLREASGARMHAAYYPKQSRFVAWTFLDAGQREAWRATRWRNARQTS